MAKKPNPVIQKAKEEGYNNGFKKGFELGQENACLVFANKFDGLEKVPGIGPKLMEKIVNHFGRDYFTEVGAEDGKQK
ncbi:hypothetical protein ACXEO8_07005 [Cytobacillus firmus]